MLGCGGRKMLCVPHIMSTFAAAKVRIALARELSIP